MSLLYFCFKAIKMLVCDMLQFLTLRSTHSEVQTGVIFTVKPVKVKTRCTTFLRHMALFSPSGFPAFIEVVEPDAVLSMLEHTVAQVKRDNEVKKVSHHCQAYSNMYLKFANISHTRPGNALREC